MPGLTRDPGKLKPVWRGAASDHALAVGWSRVGRYLAAVPGTGPVSVFDATAGTGDRTLPGHRGGTLALDWSASGALATAGKDGRVRLWDAATGRESARLEAGTGWADRLAWHPGGGLLAASAGRTLRVWDAAGTLLREFAGLPSTVADLAWRPGTGQLAAAVYGGTVLCDPALGDGKVMMAWKGSPLALAWSPDGKMLAHGNQDSTVHFWYVDRLADLQMWGYPTKVRELSWDSTGRHLATGGGPAVCVWDCAGKGPEGSKPRMLEGHAEDARLTAVAYQARGQLLSSAGTDGRVCVWQPYNRKGALLRSADLGEGEAGCLAWSPDDKKLAVGYGSGAVAVFRVG